MEECLKAKQMNMKYGDTLEWCHQTCGTSRDNRRSTRGSVNESHPMKKVGPRYPLTPRNVKTNREVVTIPSKRSKTDAMHKSIPSQSVSCDDHYIRVCFSTNGRWSEVFNKFIGEIKEANATGAPSFAVVIRLLLRWHFALYRRRPPRPAAGTERRFRRVESSESNLVGELSPLFHSFEASFLSLQHMKMFM